ncbi:hypothetical protein ACFV0H_41585, partial [Streptomyces erythrochromogenes]
MTPPRAKTWSQRGRTPVAGVRGRSRRRISIAALTCYKPGHPGCGRYYAIQFHYALPDDAWAVELSEAVPAPAAWA